MSKSSEEKKSPKECFVVMPISDPDGYPKGHFDRVFEDIFVPACEKAGFCAVRADRIKETNLIHLDVLQRILKSPMVLVDLSTRNPNVLFELGLRQAFDKPVTLVQEIGTEKIFDIAPLRYTEYRPGRVYHEVLRDQETISVAINATELAYSEGQGVNSIVKLLAITEPASLPAVNEMNRDPLLHLIRAELGDIRMDMRRLAASAHQRSGGLADIPSWQHLQHNAYKLVELLDEIDAEVIEAKKSDSWSGVMRKVKIADQLSSQLERLTPDFINSLVPNLYEHIHRTLQGASDEYNCRNTPSS